MTTVTSRVVELLDAASSAAWNSRNRPQAIVAAQAVLRSASQAEGMAAFAAWRCAVGYDGPPGRFADWLTRRYRNPGDIGLSLTRAALMTEQGARP